LADLPLVSKSRLQGALPCLLAYTYVFPDDSRVYTLRDLVSALSSKDKHLEELILDRKTGRIRGNTVILLNGTNMDVLSGLDTPLKVGDRVAVVPFLAGG